MNNVSSTLAAAGNSFNESVALLTAANAVVQDVNKASTGLRTIAARLRNTKTELDELGESMETSKYEDLVKALTDMHVSLVDINGDYRSTYDIMKDIAVQWDNMTSMEQAALATQIAGVRQQAIFYSVIEQFQEASGAMEAMENSVGSLSSAYGEYLDSVQAHIDQFKAKVQAFGQDMFDSKSMSDIIDLGSGLMDIVSIIGKIVNALGGLKLVIVGITGAIAALNMTRTYNRLQESFTTINKLVPSLVKAAQATSDEIVLDTALTAQVASLDKQERQYLMTLLEEQVALGNLDAEKERAILENLKLATSTGAVGAGAEKAAVGFGQMWAGMSKFGKLSAVLAALSLVVTIAQITGLTDAIKDLFKTTDERIEETKDKINQLTNEINTVSSDFRNLKQQADDVIPRFAKLSNGVDGFGRNVRLTDEEYKEFLSLNNQIAEMFPELNLGMDDNGNAMLALKYNADTLKESLEQLVAAQRELVDQQLVEKFGEQLELVANQVDNYKKKIKEVSSSDEALYVRDTYSALKDGTTNFEAYSGVEKALDKLGIGYGIDATALKIVVDLESVNWEDADRRYEDFMAGIERTTHYYEEKIKDEWAGLTASFVAVLKNDVAYGELDEDMQKVAVGLVRALDIGALYDQGYTTQEKIKGYIYDNIINKIRDMAPEVKSTFNEILEKATELNSGDISTDEFSNAIRDLFAAIEETNGVTGRYELLEWLNAVGYDGRNVEEIILKLINAFYNVPGATVSAGDGLEKLDEVLSNTKSAFDALDKAQKDMDEDGGLSPDTIQALSKVTDDYLDYLYEENGVIKLNTEAWKEYMAQAANSKVEALKAERDRIQGELDEAKGGLGRSVASRERLDRISDLSGDLGKINKEIAVAQGTIDYYLNQADDRLKDTISNVKSYYDLLSKAEEEMVSGHGLSADTIKTLMGLTDDYQKYLYEEDGVVKLLIDDWKEFADAPIRALEESRDALAAQLEDLDEQREAVSRYKETVAEAEQIGVDASKTVYGNIDTNDRQILEWTEDKLEEYREAIESWGMEASDLAGSISTVLGGTDNIGGLEIAISPMLQTENGAVLLTKDTVYKYIENLIAELSSQGEWDSVDLINLDAKGLEVDGKRIKGLIADIGETAEKTSLSMHFTGKDGALSSELESVKKYADAAGMSVDDFVSYIEKLESDLDDSNVKLDIFNDIIGSIANKYSKLNKTQRSIRDMVESANGLDALSKIYEDVKNGKGFDFSSLYSDDFVKYFEDCGEAYEEFVRTISESPNDIKKCQSAFNDLATAYITNSGLLDNLTEDYRDSTVALLEQNGVSNAAAIVDGQLALQKELLANASADHANNMLAEIANSQTLANVSENTRVVLARAALAKLEINKNTIKTVSDIKNLESLAKAAHATMDTMDRLAKIKTLLAKIEELRQNDYGSGIVGYARAAAAAIQIATIQAQIQALLLKPLSYGGDISFSGGGAQYTGGGSSSSSGGGSSSSGSSSSSSSSSDKTETWFEKKLKEHKHLVAMDKETLADYTKWLNTAFQKAYREGIITLDDFNKYEEEVYENRQQIFNDKIDQMERALERRASAGANPNSLVNGWRNVLKKLEAEIQSYIDAGYSRTDDVVQNLVDRAEEAREKIVSIANEALDGIQNVYKTLTDAAREYNTNGYLSVDSYQAILELGPKYLKYLKNENGELEINEKAIQKVMKLRIKELALDQALAYAQEIYNASVEGNSNLLYDLTTVQARQTSTTWDVVEGYIAQARAIGIANGISAEYYDNALENIRSMRELSELTANSLADSLTGESDEETWFDKQYKEHQHRLNMQQESDAEYLKWFVRAYKKAYEEGIITEEEFRRYEEEAFGKQQSAFSDKIGKMERALERRASAGANPNSLVNGWRNVLKKLDAEIQSYLDAGYSRSDEVVQNLVDRAEEAREKIVSIANDALDGIQNVYNTLTDAAKEYNTNGYLSVDSYQAILELGPKYLKYLKNENGELEINEKAIQKVMRLRIKELALDQALVYAQEVYNASVENNSNLLYDLTTVQSRQTSTTWDVVEGIIAQARAIGIANGISTEYYDNALQNIRSMRELSESTANSLADSLTGESDEETWFERQYKEHQHRLNMQQESESEYLRWLVHAYKQAYAEGIITEEEFWRYEEEAFGKRQSSLSDKINDIKFEINRLTEKGAGTDELERKWKQVILLCNYELKSLLQDGYDITDEVVQNVINEIDDARAQLRELFNSDISDLKFKIDERTALGADPNVLINAWRSVLGKLQDELKRNLDEGYSINSDVVQDLIQRIREAAGEIISIAGSAVDGIQNVYSTLTDAAKEWATTGYLSVDSYQSILELGPKYLSMLMDENGHLQVNEEQLQKVLALRTQELAIDQAMVYARELLVAAERNDSDALRDLTQINSEYTASTWGLVYATVGMARAIGVANGMQESYFDDAEEYIDRLRQLSITTTATIAESYRTLDEDYISQADSLEEIIKYTKDLIKFETEQHVKAIQDEVNAYKKIVDEKKESLRLSKEQDDHDRDVADKVAEIAKLQAKIDQLALDDSREARAQRASLEEQLAEKQRELTDSQSDYAYNQQVAALDKEYEAFESEKQDEINTLQDMYQSEEQLYNAAITRIQNGWETLYEQLIGWNTDYGNTLNNTITAAWNQAAEAVRRYGSFLEALEGVGSHIDIGESSSAKDLIFSKMRENSLQWFSSDGAGRKALHASNQALAEQYYNATGARLKFENNTWYDEFGMRVYDFTKDEIIKSIVNSMKQNSAAWKGADTATRVYLSQMNELLAKRIEKLLGEKLSKKGGMWYLANGKKLYDVYHSGGIAGSAPTLKQNEVLAVLEKGEAVLDKRREESLYKIVDFIKVLSDKLGSAINLSNLSPAAFHGFGVRPSAFAGDYPFNINNASFNTSVSVQIQHSGPYSKDDASRFGKQVADATIAKINEAFTKRGVSGIGSAFLKS